MGDCGEMMRERVAETKAEDGAATVVRWERFLPRMVLRVLLVESDDSTRQIITALLRKCSYKVVAVGDGLKAWEFLKGKPKNIDLILTEVDLPSISGYALLSLINEHDICKNIPVIMMSSHDSVSTVYKCMLRGAADFLVKPVRINELRNLWQHVWRRQASGRNGPQEESVAQQKVEATAENNAVSTPSSDYVACVQRNKECIEKGSDAQSSCTKPDMEIEMINGDNHQDLSHLKFSSPDINTNMQEAEKCAKSSRRKHDKKESSKIHIDLTRGEEFNAIIMKKDDAATEVERQQTNTQSAFVNSSREAIDFIGAFNDNSNFRSSGVTNNKFDSSLMLDLSLRRSLPSGSVNQVSEDKQALIHSDVSAFSRYINRVGQPLPSPASISHQQRDNGNTSDKYFSENTLNYNSDTHSSLFNPPKNTPSSATDHSRQAENSFPIRQKTVISIPVPVRGVRIDGCKPSDLLPIQIPGAAHHRSNTETVNSQQIYCPMDQNYNSSANQAENHQKSNLDISEDQRQFSYANDQSASSSFCNGSADQTAVNGSGTESRNNESPAVFYTNYQRNVQREAALSKFRLKRKERCFDKKVRYESRKKLAEQRPRVKGQFVRQAPASVETNSQCGYSVDV